VWSALALAMAMAGSEAGGLDQAARMLSLGDSYTIGESVPASERWPVQLAARLRAQGIAIADPEIVARTGWATDELSAALDTVERGEPVTLTAAGEAAPKPAPPYDLVTLLIGVNNQYRSRPVHDYTPQFRRLLERAIDYAGGEPLRVIVLSIPDWGVTPFAAAHGRDAATVGAAIDAYNAAAREVCAERGVAFIDITPLTREATDRRELLADDGLHPSGLDYARWAEAALPAARAALH
jgi:lysophospholipase L1-like esterase